MTLELTMDALCKISMDLKKEIQKGLAVNNAMIKCLPAFIPLPSTLKDGHVYVVELGGSNLRCALVSIKNGKASFVDGPIESKMPWKRDQPFSKESFLKIQADQLALLKSGYGERIGYCFSFPAKPLPDKDASLIHWVKGIHVPDMIKKKVGASLLFWINAHQHKKFREIRVVNDAIASLFSGLTADRHDGVIGLIAGTGNNMATFFKLKHIPKVNMPFDHNDKIPVNLESGNFNIPYLSKWDEMVDNNSENKKMHLFEKAVSGMYLGRIFKAVYPESAFDPETGAKGLVDMLNNPDGIKDDHILTARRIYERSSGLVAASIAGLIGVLKDHNDLNRISVNAEGRLFWSKVNHMKSYADAVEHTLSALLDELGMPGIRVDFPEIKKATLTGTAIAALA